MNRTRTSGSLKMAANLPYAVLFLVDCGRHGWPWQEEVAGKKGTIPAARG